MAAPTREACLSEECWLILCDIFNISELYQHQKVAIESTVLRREDTIICVPTGGGKSLCFEGIVPCWQHLYSSRPAADSDTVTDSHTHSVSDSAAAQTSSTSSIDVVSEPSSTVLLSSTEMVIVVSPLIALMSTQIERLKKLNFSAVSVNNPDFDVGKFKNCEYR